MTYMRESKTINLKKEYKSFWTRFFFLSLQRSSTSSIWGQLISFILHSLFPCRHSWRMLSLVGPSSTLFWSLPRPFSLSTHSRSQRRPWLMEKVCSLCTLGHLHWQPKCHDPPQLTPRDHLTGPTQVKVCISSSNLSSGVTQSWEKRLGTN